MSVEFSIGQIVRLRSGGPDMTVAGWDEAKGIVSAAYESHISYNLLIRKCFLSNRY